MAYKWHNLGYVLEVVYISAHIKNPTMICKTAITAVNAGMKTLESSGLTRFCSSKNDIISGTSLTPKKITSEMIKIE